VTAIFAEDDIPADLTWYVQLNRDAFKSETPPGTPVRN